MNIDSFQQQLSEQEAGRQRQLQIEEESRQRKLQDEQRLRASLGPVPGWADQAFLGGVTSLVFVVGGILSFCIVSVCAAVPILFSALPASWALYRGFAVMNVAQREGIAPYRSRAQIGVVTGLIPIGILLLVTVLIVFLVVIGVFQATLNNLR